MNQRSYQLLVFDWDGTLMDSIGTIVSCMLATAERLELGALDERAVRRTIGLGMRELAEELFPGREEELLGEIVACYRELWFSGYRDRQLAFEGARELLDGLAGRGLLLAIATGKSRGGLDHDLEATGLADFFHATRTVSEAPGKPSPVMLLEILDELGVRPDEALMVGDTTHDLRMAANAEVDAVAVTSGAQGRDVLAPLAPVALLETVLELPDWLDGGLEATPLSS